MNGSTPQAEPGDGPCSSAGEAEMEVKLEETSDSKLCLGCFRDQLKGRCWHEPSTSVRWAFANGRGYWCADCHSAWRTSFSQTQSLALFGKFLAIGTNREDQWEPVLLAYHTLVFESHGRVTAQMITDRVRLLTWLFGFVGLPLKPSVFVPIEDLQAASSSSSQFPRLDALDTRLLATLMTRVGPRLGIWVADNLSNNNMRMHKPVGEGARQFFVGRHLMATSSSQDQDMIADRFGLSVTGMVQPSEPSGQVVVAGQSTPTKAGSRMNVLKVSAIDLLKTFQTWCWSSMKESQFTTILTRMSTFRTDVSNEGDRELVDSLDLVWIAGLSAGKLVAKGHREWQRANAKAKDRKFAELSPNLLAFRSFLVSAEVGLVPHYSLDLMYFKAVMLMKFEECRDSKSTVSGIIEYVMEGGVCKAMARATSDERNDGQGHRVCPDEWLRALILKMFGQIVVKVPADSIAQHLEWMTADVEKVPQFAKLVSNLTNHQIQQVEALMSREVPPLFLSWSLFLVLAIRVVTEFSLFMTAPSAYTMITALVAILPSPP